MEKISNLASSMISPSHLAAGLEQNKAFPSLSVAGSCHLHQRQAPGYRQLGGSLGQLRRAWLGVGVGHVLGTRTCSAVQTGSIQDISISLSTKELSQ